MTNPDEAFNLVDRYFSDVPEDRRGEITPGRICWAPSLFLLETMTTLKVEFVRPGIESDVLLKLVAERDNPTLFNHDPVVHPPLRKDEEFVAVKAKKRPVIVLSRSHESIDRKFRRDGDFPGTYLVAPVYTFESYGEQKYPGEFVERVKAFEYHQFFYIPVSEHYGMKESFARFDRIHSVAKRNLRPEGFALTTDAWDVLWDWFSYHITGVLDDTIRDFREMRLGAIKPQDSPEEK